MTGSRPRARAQFILSAMLLLAAGAFGQEKITIAVAPEGLTLEEALQMATRDTGRNFVYLSERQLQTKKIYMPGITEVPREQIYDFWQAIFRSSGFAMVPMGPEGGEFILIEPIDSSKILKTAATYVSSDELPKWRRKAGEVILTTILLQYVTVSHVRQAVTNIIQARTAEFIHEVQSANSLIVMGFAPTVYAISQLVKAMDVPSGSATLKFEMISLENAVAEEIMPIITDLIETTAGQPQAARNQPRRAGVPPGQEKPSPKIIADPRTNSLVVYAVESDMNEIKRLVAALDTPVHDVESNIRIYFLKNTNADDLSETLRQVIGQGSTRSTRPGAGLRGAQGRPTTTNQRGQEVSIVPDANTNSLIITATKTRYDEIEPIIRKLDQARPQVLIEAAIVELSDTDLKNIGVELTAIEGGDDRYRVAGATGFGLSTITFGGIPGGDGGTGGTGGTGTGGGGGTGGTGGTSGTGGGLLDGLARIPFFAGDGLSFQGLVAGVFHSSLNVPILVSLLKSVTKGNLVSVPSVLTNDNETSRILVGREVPTVSFQTTAAGTDNRSFQDYQEADLELIITPHISSADYLRLEIQLKVEAFVGVVDVFSGVPPPKTTREFLGSVTVPNGKTIVIGGLVQDNYQETVNSVPFLGDIPVIGELFKSRSTNMEKNTLYMFVTPTIFSDFKALEDVSYQKKLELKRLQGNVKLVDPHFREVGIEDENISLEEIEMSGNLDVPRYAPMSVTGQADERPVAGIPVKPAAREDGRETVINQEGTVIFKSGQATRRSKPERNEDPGSANKNK